MAKGILARKVGMTQLFNADGTLSAVTVLEAGPCHVLGLRTAEKDGYAAVRLAFGAVKASRLNRPRLQELAKAGLEPARHLAEVRDMEGEAGQEVRCDVFSEGDLVDVRGTSKGKGFQGLVKRHRFGRGPETHGSMNVRQPGSIGATDAARVFKGVRMAGHMGARRTTAKALKVVRVDVERGLILIEGSIPGGRGSVVLVQQSPKQRVKA